MAYYDFGRKQCRGLITERVLIIAQTSVETLPHAPECARRPTSEGKTSLNRFFFLAFILCSISLRSPSGRLPVALAGLPHAVHRRKDHARNRPLGIGEVFLSVTAEGLAKPVLSSSRVVSCQHQHLLQQLIAFLRGMAAMCLACGFGDGFSQRLAGRRADRLGKRVLN